VSSDKKCGFGSEFGLVLISSAMWLCLISFVDWWLNTIEARDSTRNGHIKAIAQSLGSFPSTHDPLVAVAKYNSPILSQWPAQNKPLASLPVAKRPVNNSPPSLQLLARLL
jgi:hypothetical protein